MSLHCISRKRFRHKVRVQGTLCVYYPLISRTLSLMVTQHSDDPKAVATDVPPSWLETHKRSLFLVALFVVIFLSTRLTIRTINDTDYSMHVRSLQAFWSGKSPYNVGGYFQPPWDIFFLAPLVNQPLETWLALNVAIFAVSAIDLGTPAALILLIHPIFITLIASSNPE